MSASNIAFVNAPTVPLAVTGTSARVACERSDFVLVKNLGGSPAYIQTGDATVVAVVDTNMCVPAGAIETFRKGNKDTHLAAISSGTTTLSISSVEGR